MATTGSDNESVYMLDVDHKQEAMRGAHAQEYLCN